MRSTGRCNNRITVMLSSKRDGTKLKPYILLPRKLAMLDLFKYGGCVIMKIEGTNWRNQELAEDYLSNVIGFPMDLIASLGQFQMPQSDCLIFITCIVDAQ